MKKIFLAGFFVILLFTTCRTNHSTTIVTEKSSKNAASAIILPVPETDCSKMNLSYNSNIKPIFEEHCVSCHGAERTAGYDFNRMGDIKRAAQSGGLTGAIKWQKGFHPMPANQEQLDAKTITMIECWVNTGMKE